MFSGIIEETAKVLEVSFGEEMCRVKVEKPKHFDDIHRGDSISTDGVCLTAENEGEDYLLFCIGLETLQVTGWSEETLKNKSFNLERSLQFGARMHGHFVTGHVDTMAVVTKVEDRDSWLVEVQIEDFNPDLVWKKGSVGINGVSLTVNEVQDGKVSVCLIPETIEKTNLKELKQGDKVTIEYDTWGKAFVNFLKNRSEGKVEPEYK